MAISENHKKMWGLFDKVRFSKSLDECRKVIEEEMGPIVEEEDDLKYYADAAGKICEILEHIEEEKNPEEDDDEDGEKPEISVDFKKVMAAMSANNESRVVAFPSSTVKGKDTKISAPIVQKYVENTFGVDGENFFVVEHGGLYLVSTDRTMFKRPFIPVYVGVSGRVIKTKRDLISPKDVKGIKVKKISGTDKLVSYVAREEKSNSKTDVESDPKPTRSVKASFEEVMRGLV